MAKVASQQITVLYLTNQWGWNLADRPAAKTCRANIPQGPTTNFLWAAQFQQNRGKTGKYSPNCASSQVQVSEGHNSGAPPNSNSNSLAYVLLNFSETSFALNSTETYFALKMLPQDRNAKMNIFQHIVHRFKCMMSITVELLLILMSIFSLCPSQFETSFARNSLSMEM